MKDLALAIALVAAATVVTDAQAQWYNPEPLHLQFERENREREMRWDFERQQREMRWEMEEMQNRYDAELEHQFQTEGYDSRW